MPLVNMLLHGSFFCFLMSLYKKNVMGHSGVTESLLSLFVGDMQLLWKCQVLCPVKFFSQLLKHWTEMRDLLVLNVSLQSVTSSNWFFFSFGEKLHMCYSDMWDGIRALMGLEYIVSRMKTQDAVKKQAAFEHQCLENKFNADKWEKDEWRMQLAWSNSGCQE